MPYVSRDSAGNITGLYAGPQSYATEFLADTDASVTAYLDKSSLPTQAQDKLDASDRTILRCYENGVAVPAAWASYRKQLRAVVSGTSTTMPTQPAYPAAT